MPQATAPHGLVIPFVWMEVHGECHLGDDRRLKIQDSGARAGLRGYHGRLLRPDISISKKPQCLNVGAEVFRTPIHLICQKVAFSWIHKLNTQKLMP
jgi:hypothetical protein